jgi:S1-C subfamily serine protease
LSNNTKLIKEILEPVVRVNSRGSGLLVYSEDGMTLIVTNAHVIEDEVKDDKKLDETPFIFVDRYKYNKQGKLVGFFRSQSEIVAYDRVNDLAILRLRDEEPEGRLAHLPTKTFIDELNVFDEVYCCGCSLGGFPVPSKGILSAMNAEHDNREFWMTTAPVVMGNSGGGAFKKDKDGKYRLLGIVTAVLMMQDEEDEHEKDTEAKIIPHLNYIIPAYRLVDFINYVIDKLKNIKDDLLEPR